MIVSHHDWIESLRGGRRRSHAALAIPAGDSPGRERGSRSGGARTVRAGASSVTNGCGGGFDRDGHGEMTQNDPVATENLRALSHLDVYFAMALGCSVGDLRRVGWSCPAPRSDVDPMALLFGRRVLVYIVSPLSERAGDPRGGVALVAPELRTAICDLLGASTPETLFSPIGRQAVAAAVRAAVGEPRVAGDNGHLLVRYVTRSRFTPYVGHLQEWTEALDESAEMEPLALSLLARHSGGVHVIRERGAIASFAGIRADSPHVSDLSVSTVNERLRGQGLARAVASAATRAVLKSDRVPLYRSPHDDAAAERVACSLGYGLYGDAMMYFTAL